ncbi:MAG: response regulator [Anaerolineales bacterium]|nr:response regulator [Chloroflexota bacterium]MBL6980531.1 response regulator [Anaerolineales bacterium]
MKILLVEDNRDHRDLIKISLGGYQPTWEVQGVGNGNEALSLLEKSHEFRLVLLDYSLPGEDGLNILQQISDLEAPPPVVMVTGLGNQETAVEVMKAGAYDYVVKGSDYLTRLPLVIQRTLDTHNLKIERQQALDKLRASEERYRTLVDNSPTGVLSIDLDGNIKEVNPKLLEILGSPSAEETKNINMFNFPALIDAGIPAIIRECIKSENPTESTHPYTSKWGKNSHLRLHLTPIQNANGVMSGVQANVVDITKRVDALQELENLNNDLEERVADRTQELNTIVNSMAGREVRMAELKSVIKKLRAQLKDAGMEPISDDPLAEFM